MVFFLEFSDLSIFLADNIQDLLCLSIGLSFFSFENIRLINCNVSRGVVLERTPYSRMNVLIWNTGLDIFTTIEIFESIKNFVIDNWNLPRRISIWNVYAPIMLLDTLVDFFWVLFFQKLEVAFFDIILFPNGSFNVIECIRELRTANPLFCLLVDHKNNYRLIEIKNSLNMQNIFWFIISLTNLFIVLT